VLLQDLNVRTTTRRSAASTDMCNLRDAKHARSPESDFEFVSAGHTLHGRCGVDVIG
jgi:hypothetical protein